MSEFFSRSTGNRHFFLVLPEGFASYPAKGPGNMDNLSGLQVYSPSTLIPVMSMHEEGPLRSLNEAGICMTMVLWELMPSCRLARICGRGTGGYTVSTILIKSLVLLEICDLCVEIRFGFRFL